MTVLGKTSDAYCCLGDCCALTAEGSRECQRQLSFTHSPHTCPGFSLCKAGGITTLSARQPGVRAVRAACGLPGQAWAELTAPPCGAAAMCPTEIQPLWPQAHTCAGHVSLGVSALVISVPRGAQAQVKLSGFLCVGHS